MSVVLLSACTSYEESPRIQEPTTDKPPAMEHVPVEKACSILNGILSSPVVQENATRGVTVSPSNATAFNADGEMLTRADNEEARYYLMDIPELEMYAIMGAHTTVPPLLVLANGSANAPEVQEEDELKNFIANLPNSPDNWNLSTDPTPVDTTSFDYQTTFVYDYDNATFNLLNGVTPVDMKWGQHSPYNMYNEGGVDDDGPYDHGAVCCVAMSMAMVMTHPKILHYVSVLKPNISSYVIGTGHFVAYWDNFFSPNWQKMWNFKETEYAGIYPDRFGTIIETDIAPLLTRLCIDLNVTWGRNTSFAYSDDIESVLSEYIVSCKNPMIPYSIEAIEHEISQGYPVIISGDVTGGAGHVWVCSAILEARVPYKVVPVVQDPDFEIVIDSGIRTLNFLHHNWGWGRSVQKGEERWDYNGYYAESDTIISGKGLKYDEDFSIVVNKPNGWGTYHGFTIWTGIRNGICSEVIKP